VNADTDPAAVLAAIPGWRGASYRELPGGLTNRTLLVEKGDRRAVLKIDPAPRTPPYNSRQAEARIQEQAAALGRASRVLYVRDTVLLAEWAEGQVWTRARFEDDENLRRLAEALRSVHKLPLTGSAFDIAAAGRSYARMLDATDAAATERYLAIVESAPGPMNLCCCHNDLVAENIISTPEIRFLDWEYACDNDPLFDLGGESSSPSRCASMLPYTGSGRLPMLLQLRKNSSRNTRSAYAQGTHIDGMPVVSMYQNAMEQ
jgi:thiamine kinase